ncbi:hypothetical protein BaRGS_00037925 [Batillaria attramentaria]|uniref:C2H2-type domain-containing protein n=1 Tax=Batillaria attramentaria TaxID=370345 RepID=A0ABD0J7L8_9CAEN
MRVVNARMKGWIESRDAIERQGMVGALEGSHSQSASDTASLVGKGKGSQKSQRQKNLGAAPKPTMSMSGDRSSGRPSERDHDDFSGSGSGQRDGDRGWRAKQRNMQRGKSSHTFGQWGPPQHGPDSRQGNGFGVNGGFQDPQSDWAFGEGSSGLYTSFDQPWPDPRVPGAQFSNDRPPWERGPRFQGNQGGNRGGFNNNRQGQDFMPPPLMPGGQQNWRWGAGVMPQSDRFSWSRGSGSGRDSLSGSSGSDNVPSNRPRWNGGNDRDNRMRLGGGGDEVNREGSRWNRFARQFQDSHFHREDGAEMDSSTQGPDGVRMDRRSSGGDAVGQADSSGLDESGGSTGAAGRKRSHSMEGEKRLSKSSRAEGSHAEGVGANSTVTSGNSNLSFTGVNGSVKQKPDSTSGKRISRVAGAAAPRGLMPQPAAVSTTKPGGPAVKKKQFAESAKTLAAGVRPRSAGGAASSRSRPGEGVLERAERMCKELREKREQAAKKQSTLSSKQGGSQRRGLDGSICSIESTQSSYIKGYLSDSNLPASAGSSVSRSACPSGRSSAASGHLSDVERIRRNIESSVLAEGKAPKPRRAPGVQPAAIGATRRPSAPSSSSAVLSSSSGTAASNRPPLPQGLSKEALARMVNSPQSRAQRVQLARMLRAHTTTTAVRPRHPRLNLQLDGLYDVAGDNSVEDVLKDIGGLEEIEGLGELRNVKLEDLSMEDKLRIAQLIEDVDMNSAVCDTDKDQMVSIDIDDELTSSLTAEIPNIGARSKTSESVDPHKIQKRHLPAPTLTSTDLPEVVMDIDVPASQRARTPSPNPNRPLSLDDLNIANRSTTPTERRPLPEAKQKSPARVTRSPQRSSPTPSPALASPQRDMPRTASATVHAGDAAEMQVDGGAESDGEVDVSRGHSPQQRSRAGTESADTAHLHGTLDSILALEGRLTGVLHEVVGLCQREDSVLAEMRGIDVQLSQLYKSLIEIVARMSGLQRRRLQGEGEQLSQQRNSLLAGILSTSHAFPREDVHRTGEGRQLHPASSATSKQASVAATDSSNMPAPSNVHSVSISSASVPSQFGSSVTLPSWLSVASSNRPAADGSGRNMEMPPPSESMQGSDVCLSGSVSSSVRSETPTAALRASSLAESSFPSGGSGTVRTGASGQVSGSSLSFQQTGSLLSLPMLPSFSSGQRASKQSSARESRMMLSLGDVTDDVAGNKTYGTGNVSGGDVSKNLTASSASSGAVLEGVGAGKQKDRGLMESSSGIGSSITTHVSSTSHTQKIHSDASQSDHSTLQPDSDRGSLASLSEARHSAQQNSSMGSDSFGSPHLRSGGRSLSTEIPSSPGVNVAYVGSISSSTTSDLVQQIVRNLPMTSQLGEVGSPRTMSMYVLKPVGSENRSPSVDDISRERSTSVPADSANPKVRTRSISLTSSSNVAAELGVGDGMAEAGSLSQKSSSVVPKLNIPAGSDPAYLKTCTPRSESDANSIASSTSLGEQIKVLSEMNGTNSSAASLGFSFPGIHADLEEVVNRNHHTLNGSVRDCSVVLQRLDLDNSLTSEFVQQAETEKPKKKMKSKKDRNKALQNRRHYMVDSSSEDPSSAVEDETLPDVANVQQQLRFSKVPISGPGDRELVEGSLGQDSGDLDSTLVDTGELMNDDADDFGSENRHVSTSGVEPSRIRSNPENLETFCASVRRNLITPSAAFETIPDSSVESVEVGHATRSRSSKSPANTFKVSGPCAAVIGLEVHGSRLYVCFQRRGIQSFALSGSSDSKNYALESAQCFTVTPMGSESQPHLAVGCEDRIAFISLRSEKEVGSVPTEVKIMCVLATESRLFAGLDCGAVLVVNPKTMQVTQRFQASDCTVQCMTWTREGSTRLLCVSDQNANILIIDAGSGLPVRNLIGHLRTSFALCMSNDLVVSGSGDRTVLAHNVHTAEQVWKLADHKGIVTSVCVDNGLLFTAGYDKIIRCYDLKSLKLLHLMYGAGKCVIMKMIIHNSVLYTGNRDGQVEAIDLRDMASFACGCSSCTMVFGLKEHLLYHLVADHLLPNTHSLHCPWLGCSKKLNTSSALEKAGEHMQSHIEAR